MSTKHHPDDSDGDFHGEDDNDEDDEEEFIPGAEEEEENDDDEDGAGLEFIQGKISLDSQGKLVLQGEGFNLQSTEVFDSSKTRTSLLFVGPWQLAKADPKLKAPPRRIHVTLSAVKVGKRISDDTEDPSDGGKVFDIQGTEESMTCGDEALQFFGQVVIGTHPNDFTCRLRHVATVVKTTTEVGSPPVASASKKNNKKDDDDDDEEDCEDADDGVDFDELAALHEEARMSVDAVISKRYRESSGGDQQEGSAAKKRGKAETDDEEDIEF